MNRKHPPIHLIALLVVALLLAACGTGGPEPATDTAPGDDTASGDAVEIRYMLWDANQLPAYEECATTFEADHPNIKINIEQAGWDDYWANLQTEFVAGNAPDVFTNHLAKYPEFASKEQLVDIQPFVEEDNVATDIYLGELADLWMRDGKRYGLPKDWDTVAVIYNKEMVEAAGIDPAVMETWAWNAKDGGQFEEIIAQLTVDANGNNGLSPDFDPNNVEQYGFIPQGGGGAYGQTEWSHWAVSNGFKFVDETWGEQYYYDDPDLIETIQWYADLNLEKGYAPPFADTQSLGADAMFTSGGGAMTTDGSWMINWYVENAEFEIGFGLLPTGPQGRRTMFNGLADSIWVGSEHKEESWEWVKFLASPTCQEIVGSHAVVFPAIQSGVDRALTAYEEKGLDVTAYTDIATEQDATFLFPITDHASEIVSIMEPKMDSIMLGETTAAEALPQANQEVNNLFK